MFQTYVSSALAFSIKRGGILYGNRDEEGNVTVHAIYEPPQVRFALSSQGHPSVQKHLSLGMLVVRPLVTVLADNVRTEFLLSQHLQSFAFDQVPRK